MSACRDRSRLPDVLFGAVGGMFGEGADVGLFLRESAFGPPALRRFSGGGCERRACELWLACLDEVPGDGSLLRRAIDGRDCGLVALQASELCNEQVILAYARHDGATPEDGERQAHDVLSLARIYGHQLRLLDYGELDSLTRLLNRKTFEETFDRLLQASTRGCEYLGGERRQADAAMPAWLCVIDIDHFKRVNDTFGHLFGDEVLLRMGELMRKTFRGGDRLFRFGGEEFVVILNAADQSMAAASFNRFRMSVEAHEFPQVGTVTCSIGFTQVSGMDVPTDVVGRADEALYYAKEHGRNQVCCYEQLVAEGEIKKAGAAEAAVEEEFDIDALFG